MSSEGKSLQRGVSMLESGFLLNDGAGKKGILLPLPCSAGKRLARLLKPSDNTNGTSLPPLSKGVKGERSSARSLLPRGHHTYCHSTATLCLPITAGSQAQARNTTTQTPGKKFHFKTDINVLFKHNIV